MPGGMPRIRILLDQNAPLGLRRILGGHEVATAASRGWSTVENGDLIRAAEQAGFAVLILATGTSDISRIWSVGNLH